MKGFFPSIRNLLSVEDIQKRFNEQKGYQKLSILLGHLSSIEEVFEGFLAREHFFEVFCT